MAGGGAGALAFLPIFQQQLKRESTQQQSSRMCLLNVGAFLLL
jgi:hypothetical protein